MPLMFAPKLFLKRLICPNTTIPTEEKQTRVLQTYHLDNLHIENLPDKTRTGGKLLKKSAQYPKLFGKRVAKLHLKHIAAHLSFLQRSSFLRFWGGWALGCKTRGSHILVYAKESNKGELKKAVYGRSTEKIPKASFGAYGGSDGVGALDTNPTLFYFEYCTTPIHKLGQCESGSRPHHLG